MAGKKRAKKGVKKRAKKRTVVKRKAIKRRPAKRSPARKAKKRLVKKGIKKRAIKKPQARIIGIITHYFPKVRAAAIKLKTPLSLGDNIRIKGHTTDFTQVVNSIQIELESITQGKKGQEIGLLVGSRVRRHDIVYKV